MTFVLYINNSFGNYILSFRNTISSVYFHCDYEEQILAKICKCTLVSSKSTFIILSLQIRTLMLLNQMAYRLILCFTACKGHLNYR